MKQIPLDPETQFSELLAQFDEALATASDASSVSSQPFVSVLTDADLQQRFDRVHGCLQLLDLDRRRQEMSNAGLSEEAGLLTISEQIERTPTAAEHAVPHQIGRFRIIRRLGSGGFGVVFLAEDPVLRRNVAIKMPLATIFQSEELHDRFLRECRAAAMLNHPGIVRVLESGDVHGIPYQVTEFVNGERLSDLLKRQRPTVQASAKIVRSLADAVQHAHDHGVLHRDIKPDNILLQTTTGTALEAIAVPRITDFGLARIADDNTALSRSGMLVGTPKYMSPEQLHGKVRLQGPQSDVYSLGVVLHELLTGSIPFADSDNLQSRIAISGNPVASFRSAGAGISKDLETICLKCLRLRPEDRYASAGDLRDDLSRYLDGRPTLARPIPVYEQFARWVAGNRKLTALLSVLTLLVFVVFVQAIRNDRASREQNRTLSSTLSQLTAEKQRADESLKLANIRGIEVQQSESRYRDIAWLARQGEYSAAMMQAFSLCHDDEIAEMNKAILPFFPSGEDDLADFTWRYLWNQGQTLRPLMGHSGLAYDLAITKDGEHAWSIGEDNTVRRWHLNSGLLESTWKLKGDGWGHRVAISQDSRRAVISQMLEKEGTYNVAVYDLETGKALMQRNFPISATQAVAISRDGNTVLVGGQECIHENVYIPFVEVWVPDTDRVTKDDSSFRTLLVGEAMVPGHTISALSLAPDGNGVVIAVMGEFLPPHTQLFQTSLNVMAAAASDQPTSIFGPLTQLQWHPGIVHKMTFSPNGDYLATTLLGEGDSFWANVWNLKERALVRATEEFSRPIGSIAFDSTSTKLGIGLTLPGLNSEGNPAGAGEKAETHAELEFRLWDFVADTKQTLSYQPQRYVEFLKPLNLGASSDWIVGEASGVLFVWRPGAVARFRELTGHRPKEVWDLVCSPDGFTVFSVGDDHSLRSWDLASGVEKKSATPRTSLVSCVAVSPDGRWVAAGGYDDEVVVYGTESLNPAATLTGHTHDLRALAFSPDSRLLATGGRDRMIRLWNVPGFDLAGIREDHRDTVRALTMTTNGQLISSGSDGRILVWDSSGHVIRERIEREQEGVHSLAFAPAGLRMPVPSASTTASRVESRSNTESGTGQTSDQSIITVQADELLALGMKHGTVRLWHLPTDTIFFEAQHHGAEIRSLAFSPDGRTLAVAGTDDAVYLWHVATGRNVLTFEQLGFSVHRVAFSPDGTHLLAAMDDGTIRIWHAPPVP